MSTSASGPDLESVWYDREETIYPALFGQLHRGIFPLGHEQFASLGHPQVDPRWLTHGVLEFAPSKLRESWLYVTSGTSNPWEVPPEDFSQQEFSGVGTELVLEAPVSSDWAINALSRLLAYNLLLAHGQFGQAFPLDYGARVPLGGPIDGSARTCLRFVAVGKASHYATQFTLASGAVDLLHIVGISESEREYARVHGTATLIDRLGSTGAFPVTDPARSPVA